MHIYIKRRDRAGIRTWALSSASLIKPQKPQFVKSFFSFDRRWSVRLLQHDDGLGGGAVGIGEVDLLLTLGGDGHARHAEVGLAAVDGRNYGVKLHVLDFQVIGQLVARTFRKHGSDATD